MASKKMPTFQPLPRQEAGLSQEHGNFFFLKHRRYGYVYTKNKHTCQVWHNFQFHPSAAAVTLKFNLQATGSDKAQQSHRFIKEPRQLHCKRFLVAGQARQHQGTTSWGVHNSELTHRPACKTKLPVSELLFAFCTLFLSQIGFFFPPVENLCDFPKRKTSNGRMGGFQPAKQTYI